MSFRAVLAIFLVLPSFSVGDPAEEAQQQLLAAAEILADAETAVDRVSALTNAVRAYENGLQATRAELRRLTLQERELSSSLADEYGDISTFLVLLQNASRMTETQSLLYPGDAADTLRAGTLAGALVGQLDERAADLEVKLKAVTEVRSVIEAAKASILEGFSSVQSARSALGEALRDRTELPPRLATNTAAMEALLNSADTLGALADSVASTDGSAREDAATGWKPLVTGEILVGFDPKDAASGWSVSTEPRALLTSPMDATVRFSGEFPGRGKVVILEGGAASLLLLAGLSTSFVALGQVVAAGDPVALAGDGQSAAQDKLNAGVPDVSLALEETVYIELRQDGAPVDPATRLTLEQEQG
ncbi:MAG: peptidoglycan DD-metalloendopeptidase family protein [Pseudomonadota bacterium]